MAHFVETDKDFINLDHVATVCESGDRRRVMFYDPTGKLVGTYTGDKSAAELCARAIPAAPGATAIVVTVCGGEHRPTDGDVYTTERAIVGWRLDYDAPTPILTDDICSGERVLIREPDGRLTAQCDATFDSIDNAKSEFLARHQADWDRAHAHTSEAA